MAIGRRHESVSSFQVGPAATGLDILAASRGRDRDLEATIVHSHVSLRIDDQAEAAVSVARVPWVWTIHGMYKPEGSELDRWKRAVKTLHGGRGRVMGVSEAIVSDLEARGVRPPGGAVLIHGGVDFKAFSAAPATARACVPS